MGDYFRLNNVLLRKVGGSMVLEAQKKAVKRQALMERVLAKDLPDRMKSLAKKKATPHIPWYYQIDMPGARRMSVGPGQAVAGSLRFIETFVRSMVGAATRLAPLVLRLGTP